MLSKKPRMGWLACTEKRHVVDFADIEGSADYAVEATVDTAAVPFDFWLCKRFWRSELMAL